MTKVREFELGQRWAWPGGYPIYYLCSDGGTLCPDCTVKEGELIRDAWDREDRSGGWYVEACDVNWEDPDLLCDHCGKRLESAYREEG